MLSFDQNSRTAICPFCRVYSYSQHMSTCDPKRPIRKVGRGRHVARDRRTSAVARANARLQAALIANL